MWQFATFIAKELCFSLQNDAKELFRYSTCRHITCLIFEKERKFILPVLVKLVASSTMFTLGITVFELE